MKNKGKVLMIYTGGTIGMLPQEENNPKSPLVPANWDKLRMNVPVLDTLPLEVDLHEMMLIDSSDMHPDYWIDIAKVIGEKYDQYDGFVILHGTDTMTYTATALSFLLENLSKPVILTGSQISIGQARSDAVQNLVTSLTLASPETFGLPVVPEVCIFFNNSLLRGNRARKVSSSAYTGFDSPNFDHLGIIGEHIKINKKIVRKPSDKGFFINENLEQNVLMFDIFPGINPHILRNLFEIENLKGVVLRTFGAGNAPTNEDFLREIEYGINEKNLTIVNITQCVQGMVEMGLYDASAQLLKLGVISGADMTPEAALVKMQFLLGMGYDTNMLKEQMQRDLRGEQSVNIFNFLFDHGKADMVYKAPAKQVLSGFVNDNIVAANIRVDNVSVPENEEIQLAFFLNYPNADSTVDLSEDDCLKIPQCLGITKKAYNGKPISMILDCSERLGRVITPDRPVQVTIVSRTKHPVKWDGISISVYTSVE